MNSPAYPQMPLSNPSMFLTYMDIKQISVSPPTAKHALAIGIDPEELVRYAKGNCVGIQRIEFESLLMRSPWAISRIVALVKESRRTESLGSSILAATHSDPYVWGVDNTGDLQIDFCRLLERIDGV